VCYVLAEAFDEDPFAMLAWRGKGRDDLLAALRRLAGGGREDGGRHSGNGARDASGGRGARAGNGEPPVIEVVDKPLAECTADFWSTPLSPARLRALPPATSAPADLLLRSLEPPMITVGGLDLVTLLRPAYLLMPGTDGDDRGEAGSD
jgi:hypothetical protein